MVKNLHASVGDRRNAGLIPVSGRCPGGGKGNPLQCSCMKNFMGRGAWWLRWHGIPKSWTWLSTHAYVYAERETELTLSFKLTSVLTVVEGSWWLERKVKQFCIFTHSLVFNVGIQSCVSGAGLLYLTVLKVFPGVSCPWGAPALRSFPVRPGSFFCQQMPLAPWSLCYLSWGDPTHGGWQALHYQEGCF